MSKIDLNLDFDAILKRIEGVKKGFRPSDWASLVGVSRNIVTNIHGKTKQKPSMEYIIAVARAFQKPVEYFLWGTKDSSENGDKRVVSIKSHYDIVNEFSQKELAKELNLNALKLELLNPDALKEINEYIKYRLQSEEKKQGELAPGAGTKKKGNG